MKGLELARAYFELYGKPVLAEHFPDLYPKLAFGLCGSGSECYGYDDELSQDHDFEPGFCIFLPDESVVSRREAFQLERAYASLPDTMDQIPRLKMQPAGGARHGVIRIADFFTEKVGAPDGRLSFSQWLTLPDYALSEATNGVIFEDNYGEVTRIRAALHVPPQDVTLKKLAGQVLVMAQSGQYNYTRCLRHGETGAAQLAVCEFVKAAMQTVFLLNRVYMPYYKWSFRAMRGLERLSILAELLEYLLISDNDSQAEEKQQVIEGIASDVIDELKNQDLSDAVCGDLEKHAYSIQDHIKDSNIRNMHILAAV